MHTMRPPTGQAEHPSVRCVIVLYPLFAPQSNANLNKLAINELAMYPLGIAPVDFFFLILAKIGIRFRKMLTT